MVAYCVVAVVIEVIVGPVQVVVLVMVVVLVVVVFLVVVVDVPQQCSV